MLLFLVINAEKIKEATRPLICWHGWK